MELPEKRNKIAKEIDECRSKLASLTKQFEGLEDLKEVTLKDLYNGIDNYFTIEIKEGKYEYILGGDGRGAPCSEQRTGTIGIIYLDRAYFLDELHVSIIKDYVLRTTNCVYLKIENEIYKELKN